MEGRRQEAAERGEVQCARRVADLVPQVERGCDHRQRPEGDHSQGDGDRAKVEAPGIKVAEVEIDELLEPQAHHVDRGRRHRSQ